MALIFCPKCGRKISDRSSACPHCGTPMSKISQQALNHVAPSKQVSTKKPPIYGAIAGLSYRVKLIVSPRVLSDASLKNVLGEKFEDEAQRIALRALYIYFYDQQKPEDNKTKIKPVSKEDAKRIYLYFIADELVALAQELEKKKKVVLLKDQEAFFAACVAKKPSKAAQVLELPGIDKKAFSKFEADIEKLLGKYNQYR